MRWFYFFVWILMLVQTAATTWADANRLRYLDEPLNPYYVHRDFAKLTTPQWIGQEGVDAVVVLAIDDMRDAPRYEAYLRPILERLKQIDGRAPISIMTNQIDPSDPQLQPWLKEGVSLEIHTVDHPCPLLQGGDFQKAKSTYERCVDLMATIPGNRPVAFRMPCCDSMNSPSPRFWTEIFAKTTAKGNYLSIDSSVFNITTSADPELPRDWTTDPDGRARFEKYLPFPSFVNTIRDYPYPYMIGDVCWEFPCIVPSDWEAQNLHQPNNPRTVTDLKRALDAVVQKKGVFNLVFHPHGWIRSEQVIELIDYAVERYAGRVTFLNFREADERLQTNLLSGRSLRQPSGEASGVRLLDVDHDGHMDVVRRDPGGGLTTRVWRPASGEWHQLEQPMPTERLHFGVLNASQVASFVAARRDGLHVYTFSGDRWVREPVVVKSLAAHAEWPARLARPGQLDAIGLHDLDGEGGCELILASGDESLILSKQGPEWVTLPFQLPQKVRLSPPGQDSGFRFVDIDQDGRDDCLFSNPTGYSLHLFHSMENGWSRRVVDSTRAEAGTERTIPTLVRPDGTNNGTWFHSSQLWIQNEDTDRLPDKVDRIAYRDLLELGDDGAARFPGPTAARASLDRFQVAAGYRIELVAAEPLVADPVAFDWGPDGRLWVVEMRDYPNGVDGHGQPGGRVKVLDDDDGDGRFDRAQVFLDELPFPTGVKVWRDGILVASAPHVFYAEDTDGDDRADVRRILFQGFGEGNQQHRVNGLVWGLDNWLYLANGDSGGEILSVQSGQKLALSGRDLKLRPDDGAMEALSGQTQFGRNRDAFGNWFGGNNSYPVWHYVLEDRYVRRNSHYAVPSVRKQVSRQPGPAPVFPASRTLPRFNDFDRVNRFTSACSPIVYRDGRGGAEAPAYTLVCEPVHNLVQRELLERQGVSFASQRLSSEQNREFLASADNWFRPVMVRPGPDGAIWIADMYRLVIEHPTWIPMHWQKQLDVRSGHDRGRIYRVRSANSDVDPVPRFDQMSSEQLVKVLEHPNGCRRDIAHQMLFWRLDPGIADRLKTLVNSAPRPATAIHCLYLLDAQGQLDSALLEAVIADGDSRVARHAMRLAERRFEQRPALAQAIIARANGSDDDSLLLQAVCSLGQLPDGTVADWLAQTARARYDDPFLFPAVMTSLHAHNVRPFVLCCLRDVSEDTPVSLMTSVIQQGIAVGDETLRAEILRAVADSTQHGAAWQLPTLATVLETLQKRSVSFETLPDDARRQLTRLMSLARQRAQDDHSDPAQRVRTIRLLRGDVAGSRENLQVLTQLIDPRQPPEIQSAAVSAIFSFFSTDAVPLLLSDWANRSPTVRNQILDEVLQRPALTTVLLDDLAAGASGVTLAARHRQRLLDSSDEAIRQRARRVLKSESSQPRQEIIDSYARALNPTGRTGQGQAVFKRQCATCHRLGELGHAVGPDLATVTNRSREALLADILDPNRAVEEVYRNYVVETNDGRQFAGIVTAETGTSLTLTAAESKQHMILRRDIDRLHGSGKSLMPEDIDRDLTPEDANHLIAFLRSHRPPHKRFAGNTPQQAPVRDDGSIRLFAVHAKVYGPSLQFEPRYRNLGFWSESQDYAAWQVDLPKAGTYKVALDYACDDSCAGNRYLISCGDQQLSGTVAGTGTWDDYHWSGVGQMRLPAGQSEVLFRSDGPIRSFLIDLRTIILSPVE